jgi:nucleotide-binding universal stress UspA family protein
VKTDIYLSITIFKLCFPASHRREIINTKKRCLAEEIPMLYEKILAPIDGSALSMCALQEAIRLAKTTGGAITAIFASPETSHGSSFVMPQLPQSNDRERVLEEAKKAAKAADITIEALLLEGKVAEKILKTANDGLFDLIVIGARRLSNISGFIFGSVSQAVSKNASCPVLVTH